MAIFLWGEQSGAYRTLLGVFSYGVQSVTIAKSNKYMASSSSDSLERYALTR